MTTWFARNLTIYVTMVICLGCWSGHVTQTLSQDGFRHHSKQLKSAQGQLLPDTDSTPWLQEEETDQDPEDELHDSDLDEGIYLPAIRPVSEHDFRMKMRNAQTYHDVLRIFLGESLTDFDIDKIMTTHRYIKQPLSIPGSSSTSIRKLPTKEDWMNWEITNEESSELGKCHQPVKEIVRVRDITHLGGEIYYPDCLVHYVCNATTGCCGAGKQCGPIQQEDVIKTVMVMKFTGPGGTSDGFPDVRYLALANHTRCGCVDIPESTLRPCPYPFNHSLHDCRCVSPSLKAYCERIVKGKETLLTPDIDCIVEGRCRPLDNCLFGVFDMDKKRCPTKEEATDTGSGAVEKREHPKHP